MKKWFQNSFYLIFLNKNYYRNCLLKIAKNFPFLTFYMVIWEIFILKMSNKVYHVFGLVLNKKLQFSFHHVN